MGCAQHIRVSFAELFPHWNKYGKCYNVFPAKDVICDMEMLSAIGTLLTFRSRVSVDPAADNYDWWQVLPEAGNKIWTSGSCSATPPRRIHIAGYTPPEHSIYFNINLRSFDNNCVLLSNIIAMQTLIIFHSCSFIFVVISPRAMRCLVLVRKLRLHLWMWAAAALRLVIFDTSPAGL